MDRSAKGVVPRTCLSKMPVKPRGPPSPNGPPPAGANNMPPPPPGANAPRPLTPNQNQQGQQGRPRAPTLDNMPARKPVPGQALYTRVLTPGHPTTFSYMFERLSHELGDIDGRKKRASYSFLRFAASSCFFFGCLLLSI